MISKTTSFKRKHFPLIEFDEINKITSKSLQDEIFVMKKRKTGKLLTDLGMIYLRKLKKKYILTQSYYYSDGVNEISRFGVLGGPMEFEWSEKGVAIVLFENIFINIVKWQK